MARDPKIWVVGTAEGAWGLSGAGCSPPPPACTQQGRSDAVCRDTQPSSGTPLPARCCAVGQPQVGRAARQPRAGQAAAGRTRGDLLPLCSWRRDASAWV